MKTHAPKSEIEAIILRELRDRYPDISIEAANLVILPEKDWGVVVVSDGQPMTGPELAHANQIANDLQSQYEIIE
jgi:hypothetical protein